MNTQAESPHVTMKAAHQHHIQDVIKQIRAQLREEKVDALLVTTPENVRYLSGFTSPEDGRVLITPEQVMLITDGRYDAQSKAETSLEIVLYNSNWRIPMIKELLGDNVLAIEANHMSVFDFDQLNTLLEEVNRPRALAAKDFIREHRLCKTAYEIDKLRQAAALTDQAFSHILEFIKVGMREVEVAVELERFMRLNGAEAVSFPIIVASGYRSAMPHGVASEKVIADGELVTIDMGARLAGYHADMTRTIAMGTINQRDQTRYARVLEAQEASLAAVAAGKEGAEIDGITRDIFRKYDVEQYYPHGLGHGVGLNIHEGPRLSKFVKGSQILKPNMAVTIEPGIYVPDESGVRIEDLVIITEDGCERLSHSSKELIHI